jgi:hypothetical protein
MLEKGRPYDAEIEYLESTTTQYINTNISLSTDMIISCTYAFSETNEIWRRLFGWSHWTQEGWGNTYSFCYNTSTRICPRFVVGVNSEVYLPKYTSGKYEVSLNTNGFVHVKGLDNAYNQSSNLNPWQYSSAPHPIYLYNFGGSSIVDGAKCKVYGFKIKSNNKVLLNFTPVRVGNVGYMYDKVSGKLFGNSGTGNFILGPDK